MVGEISLDKRSEKTASEEEKGWLGNLEEKVDYVLLRYQEMKKERDEMVKKFIKRSQEKEWKEKLVRAARDFLDNHHFILLDAPILTPAACEGTSNLFATPYFDQGQAARLNRRSPW